MNGRLVVACHQICPKEVIEQHIRTQVVWRRIIKSDIATPILYSKPILHQEEERRLLSKEEAISQRVKSNVLDILAGEGKPTSANWVRGGNRERIISRASRLLFVEGSIFDVTQWVSPAATKKRVETEKDFREKMEKAFDVVNLFANVRFAGTKEWELFVANLLASYPLEDWETAKTDFDRWEYKNKHQFKRSLDYPRKTVV